MENLIEQIDGVQFGKMILSAAAAIEMSRQEINELNVFPVPDGDTGTNMSLTMSVAVKELQKNTSSSLGGAADIVAQGLLRGARGNSGVILSLLFRGFARSVREYDTISGIEFAHALADGVDAAYRAVMKPAEGTILTVSSQTARRAKSAYEEDTSIEHVLGESLAAAELALQETVHQNPVLAKAGVIDAGGKGFCVILDGMLRSLRGEGLEPVPVTEGAARGRADFSEYSTEDITFAYCTEFIVLRGETKRDPRKLHALLGSIGDSLVFVDDEKIFKVHVHTNNPGKALEEALLYGQLTSIKIENMREQHTQKVVDSVPSFAKSTRRYGFVSVCSGKGVCAVFNDLGVDNLIEGGQTMNPSTEDILSAVNQTPSEIVFVLPNNKNIIMAAEQCVPLTDKTVIVLPTKSIPQGISAMLAFEPSDEPEANREAMISAMSAVSTGQVTYAARESNYDGRDIREGDHMALLNGQLIATNRAQIEVLRRLSEEIAKLNPSFITIFYGTDTNLTDAETALRIYNEACPSAEINLIDGGQPVYSFLISAE